MSQKPKPTDEKMRTEKLRDLRMAAEAERRTAGTWGDRRVGEIVHDASQTVYVQVWKGPRRPDPLSAGTARSAGVTQNDWLAISVWLKERRAIGFSDRLIAWDLSADEAERIRLESILRNREAGRTVINSAAAAA